MSRSSLLDLSDVVANPSVLRLSAFTAVLGSFCFGYNLCVMSTMWNIVSKKFEWCPNGETTCENCSKLKGWVDTCFFIGATVGCLMAGPMIRIGRRKALMFSDVFNIGGSLCCAFAPAFWMLAGGRLLSGLGVGIVTVAVPAYMSEMIPADVRGFYGFWHQVAINVGIAGVTGLGLPLTQLLVPSEPLSDFDRYFQGVMFLGSGIAGVVQLIILFTSLPHETPAFLLERDDHVASVKVLQQIWGDHGGLKMLKQGVERVEHDRQSRIEIGANSTMSVVQALSRPYYRTVTLVGCMLAVMQQLSGINVVMTNATTMLQNAGYDGRKGVVAALILTLLNTGVTLGMGNFVESIGRRKLLLWGTLGQVVALLPPAVCFFVNEKGEVPQIVGFMSLAVFIIAFATAAGPVTWIYLSECFPLELKAADSVIKPL
eukprot:GHVR01161135.1.p1 GENE.GHVR01161135.1~~GHVR01161135.1.p1  ORF type:complete len:429 (-),score=80.54 GHVR01161135.1:887-2173(-)